MTGIVREHNVVGLGISVPEAIEVARGVLIAEGFQSVAAGPTAATFVRSVREHRTTVIAFALAVPTLGLSLFALLIRSQEHCTVSGQESRRGTRVNVTGTLPVPTLQTIDYELRRRSGPQQAAAGESLDEYGNPFPVSGRASQQSSGRAQPPVQSPPPPVSPQSFPAPFAGSGSFPTPELAQPPFQEPSSFPPADPDPYVSREPSSNPFPPADPDPYVSREPSSNPFPPAEPDPYLPHESDPFPVRGEPDPFPSRGEPDPFPSREPIPAPSPFPSRKSAPAPSPDPFPSRAPSPEPFPSRAPSPEPYPSREPAPDPFPFPGASPAAAPPQEPVSAPPSRSRGPVRPPDVPVALPASPARTRRPRPTPLADPASDHTVVWPAPAGFAAEPSTSRWVLTIDDGREIEAEDFGLIGRDPEPTDDDPDPAPLVPMIDPEMSVSKTHAAFGVDDVGLWFMDRRSTNGTSMVPPGEERVGLEPGVPTQIPPGSEVWIGRRRLTVDFYED